MPTYDYSCTQCAHSFEMVQSFTDDALTTCPECQGRLRKVFGNVGVVFKGSGFYRNDARDAAKKSTSPNSSAHSTTKTEGSTDSAPPSGSTEASSAKPTSTESPATAGASTPPTTSSGTSPAGSSSTGSGSAA